MFGEARGRGGSKGRAVGRSRHVNHQVRGTATGSLSPLEVVCRPWRSTRITHAALMSYFKLLRALRPCLGSEPFTTLIIIKKCVATFFFFVMIHFRSCLAFLPGLFHRLGFRKSLSRSEELLVTRRQCSVAGQRLAGECGRCRVMVVTLFPVLHALSSPSPRAGGGGSACRRRAGRCRRWGPHHASVLTCVVTLRARPGTPADP